MKTSKERIQLVVIGILAVVLVLACVRTYMQMQSKKMKRGAGAAAVQSVSADQTAPLYVTLAEEAGQISIERDPFFPVPKVSASSIVLNGILWDEVKPTAIINNEIVQVGQSVNGKVVVGIWKDKVILSDGSNEVDLKMYEE